MSGTVAEIMADVMASFGIKRIYGIPGDSIDPLVEAVRKTPEIKYVQTRHEEGAAFAASFDSKFNGHISACFGTSGPGSIHLLNGLYDAKLDHAPVLAITGQVARDLVGRDYHQEVNMFKLFDDVSVYNRLLLNASIAPFILSRAITEAVLRRGVAHINVPVDLLMDRAPSTVPQMPVFPEVQYRPNIERVKKLLDRSARPVLLIGSGARNAASLVDDFSSKIGAPIIYALNGKGILPDSDPRVMGGLGLLGTRPSVDAVKRADLILMLGTSFPYFKFIPPGTAVVQVDINADVPGSQIQLTESIVDDAGAFISHMQEGIAEKEDKFFLELEESRKRWLRELQRQENAQTDSVNPKMLSRLLSEETDDDSVIVTDTGNTTVWIARHFRATGSNRFLFSGGLASMGNSIPGSVGVALSTGRQIISAVGDGGFAMTMMELSTVVKYDLPIKFVIFNNGKLGMIKFEQEVLGYPQWGIDLKNPDFSTIAEAYGIPSARIETGDSLREGLRKMLSSRGPFILEAITGPDAKPMPPYVTVSQVKGYAMASIREHVGYTPEAE